MAQVFVLKGSRKMGFLKKVLCPSGIQVNIYIFFFLIYNMWLESKRSLIQYYHLEDSIN